MSEDFVRHNIYLPFAQQDPIASGMGLGLSLVKRNVDSLRGTIDIETDQALGTTAKISIPTNDLVAKADTNQESDTKSQIPIGIMPFLPKRRREDLPFMHACFYAPSTWLRRFDKRDERSIDLVFDSLSSTLCEWYQPVLSLWQHQMKRTIPDLIFISQQNLAEFTEECGEEFADVKKVVICAAIGKNSSQDQERIRQASTVADALITGAVMPSKLWEVVTTYFPHILRPGASAGDQKHHEENADSQPKSLDTDEPEKTFKEQKDGDNSSRNLLSKDYPEPDQSSLVDSDKQAHDDKVIEKVAAISLETDEQPKVEADLNATPEDEGITHELLRTLSAPMTDTTKAMLRRRSTVPILQGLAQPHMLLVDDNTINIKMIGMFASKCGIPAAQSTSVPGGQEAIDAYKAFERSNAGPAKGFDIILMDLSMPEVSGFDATSAIRQMEKNSDHGHRAYIVALTGLVSDKDRVAAFEAGVDDYVTKPAGLQKVRDIIETWQKRRQDSLDVEAR